MSGTGLILAIVGALSWSTLDVVRKQVGSSLSATAAVATLTFWQLPFLAVAMGVGEWTQPQTAPWSIIANGFPTIPAEYFWPFLGAVALNVLANWLFLRAVQISPLSLTIPYLSFTPVFTAVSGLVMLGETPTVWGWGGIGVVGLGAFFLNPGASDGGFLAPVHALWKERGSFYMLLVAAIWSITPVLDKIGSLQTNVMGHTAFLAAGIFAVFFGYHAIVDRSAWKILSRFRVQPALLAFGGFMTVVAMVSQISAYHYMDLAYVETIKRAIGMIAAIVIGWLWFDEADFGRRLFAALVMAAGVAMVLVGG